MRLIIVLFFVLFSSNVFSKSISLDIRNLPVLNSFQLLADYNRSNFVVSPLFDKELLLTVKVTSLDWQVAFDHLLAAANASYVLSDNVYFIYPAVVDDSTPVYSPAVFDIEVRFFGTAI